MVDTSAQASAGSGAGLQNVVTSLQNAVTAVNAISSTISNSLPGGVTAIINAAVAQVTTALAPATLADAAVVAVDMSTSNFTLLATSSIGPTRQLQNPTNAAVGQSGFILWTQDGVGSRALTFDTQYQAAGGVAGLTPTTTANAKNLFLYWVLPGPIVALMLLANVEH